MSAFLYGVALQWRLDIRSKTILVTCYVVPLLFFAVMGGIFSTVNPVAKETLIQAMTIMGVTMCAAIGLPPSLVELYGGDMKKVYKANGVPQYLGLISMFLSTFIHIFVMSTIIYIAAPIMFDATLPANPILYFGQLAIFVAVSLSVGCVLGLLVKKQAKLTMISQIVFLPSIMLSGIMFPSDMLPKVFEVVGKIFPASWGYIAMSQSSFDFLTVLPLLIIFALAAVVVTVLIKRMKAE